MLGIYLQRNQNYIKEHIKQYRKKFSNVANQKHNKRNKEYLQKAH